jgi:hypothetical protein
MAAFRRPDRGFWIERIHHQLIILELEGKKIVVSSRRP